MIKKSLEFIREISTVLLIVGLTLLVILLGLQNRKLKNRLELLSHTPVSLQINEKVPVLRIRSLMNEYREIDFEKTESVTLLFVFSTTCPSCVKSLAIWNEITDSVKGSHLTIMGISIHDSSKTALFLKHHALNFPVYLAKDTSFERDFKVESVPQTILITRRGFVANNWTGRVDSTRRNDLFDGIFRHSY